MREILITLALLLGVISILAIFRVDERLAVIEKRVGIELGCGGERPDCVEIPAQAVSPK